MHVRSKHLAALLAACAVAAAGCGSDDSDDGGDSGGSGDSGSSESAGGGGAYGSTGGDKTEKEASGGASGGASTLKLAADPSGSLKFDKTSLTAKPGTVRIVMDNPSQVPHAVALSGGGVEEVGATVGKGGVSRVAAELEPGEYDYVCPVGNHADAGMVGTLTVR